MGPLLGAPPLSEGITLLLHLIIITPTLPDLLVSTPTDYWGIFWAPVLSEGITLLPHLIIFT